MMFTCSVLPTENSEVASRSFVFQETLPDNWDVYCLRRVFDEQAQVTANNLSQLVDTHHLHMKHHIMNAQLFFLSLAGDKGAVSPRVRPRASRTNFPDSTISHDQSTLGKDIGSGDDDMSWYQASDGSGMCPLVHRIVVLFYCLFYNSQKHTWPGSEYTILDV